MVKLNKKRSGRFFMRKATGILAIWVTLCFFSESLVAQHLSGYLNQQKLSEELQQLSQTYPEWVTLESIGKSMQQRDIWLVTLAGRGAEVAKRPALLIAANLEANQPVGTELAVRMMKDLLTRYPDDPAVQKLLNSHVVYVLPRINPDGTEAFLSGVAAMKRSNLNPYDADNDGRVDEDGPEDLNNDGIISVMRVADPEGRYMSDETIPELLRVADANRGEIGQYKVYWEGFDNDGDGFINEDPDGGIDINRNFAHEYPYYQSDAGIHMVSEPETRAVMDWMISHRNVSIILTFSESDNLLNPPDNRGRLQTDRTLSLYDFAESSNAGANKTGMFSSRSSMRYGMYGGYYGGGGQDDAASSRSRRPSRKAATTYHAADQPFYNEVSRMYKEVTGIQKSPVMRNPKGAFSEYGYFQFGVLSVTHPGWGMPQVKDSTQPEDGGRRAGRQGGMMPQGGRPQPAGAGVDADVFRYLKDHGLNGFVPWQKFDHPDLGVVEIGGFDPRVVFNPPVSELDQLAVKQSEFILKLSALFAQVKIVSTEVNNLGDGLFSLQAVVKNIGYLPTTLQQGADARAVKPVKVLLDVDPDQILSGDSKISFIRKLDAGDTQRFEWLIRTDHSSEVNLLVEGQKAGQDQQVFKLK